MYTALFTEFSYGYALTDNLMHCGLPHTAAAPVFPSLFAEGSSGGGYDVKIPLFPVPLFLQFKIPQVIRRRSPKMPSGFSNPYMRMHLRTKRPNQHKLLWELEKKGNIVAYATPNFWSTKLLDSYFTSQQVHLRTRYIRPATIGPLDTEPHHVAYCVGCQEMWRFSKPKPLQDPSDAENFGSLITEKVRTASFQNPLEFLNSLSSEIADLTGTERPTEFAVDSIYHKKPSVNAEPARILFAAREAAYLAQVRLGCTLILAGRDK